MAIEVASVSIPTFLNLSGFNSGLAVLQRTKINPLSVEVRFNTQSLERDRKQLQETLAKPLTLGLEVDDTALMTLRRRLQRQSPYKIKAVVELDTRSIDKAKQQTTKSFNSLPVLKVRVDDTALTKLNIHAESKRTHVKDLNKWMAANPLKIHTDTSKVDAFEKRNIKSKRIRVDVEYNDPGYKSSSATRHSSTTSTSPNKLAFDFAKPLEAQTKALDSCIDSAADKIADAIDKGFKSQRKGLLGNVAQGLLFGATFKGGQAIYDKATGKAKQTITTQKEQRQAYTQLSHKTEAAKIRQQNKEAEQLRQQMLQMNNRDVIQPLAKKSGVKATTKAQAVEGLLGKQSAQTLKTQLPYIDTIRKESAKVSQQLSTLTAQQLKTQLSSTTKQLSSTFKSIKGTGNIGGLSDLGNQIEKEYQAVIAALSQATEEDAKNVLQSAKLQIAKIRKATSTEAQQVSVGSINTQAEKQSQQHYLRRAKSPKFNILQQRRIKEMQYNARLVDERAEQIYQTLPDLPKDTKRIALVSGGFASKYGKSSQSVADRMKPFLGEGTHVQPIENPDTDWGDYDPTVEKDPVSWAKNALKVVAKHNLNKGYKEDSIQAAAYAKAYAKKAKAQGLDIPNIEGYGYSAGGFVMQEAAELSRETKTPFKGVGIGTPHYGISNTASQEDYISLLGGQDPLSKLQTVKSPNLRTYEKAGRKHLLEEYTNNPDVQRDVYAHVGREAPFALGQDFEENMMSAMSAAQESLSINPKMRPTLAASGAIDPVIDELTKHRERIADQIDNIPKEILEDVQAADEVLQSLQNQLIKGFGLKGRKVTPLAQPGAKPVKTSAQTIVGADPKEQQILKNYHAILKEMADIAGVTVDQIQIPKLTVDQDKLNRLGSNAYYDSGSRNEVTIRPELAELLALPTEELQKYGKELNSVTHELFHSIDLAFGKKTIGGLAKGKDKITTPLTPAYTKNGERMARVAMADVKHSQPRVNDSYVKTIGELEQRAYSFQASTDEILKRVAVNPQAIEGIRTATDRSEQLGKDLGKVVRPPNLEPIINNGLNAYKGLTAKQAKQLEQNYINFFKEVANISDFDLSGRTLPELHIDEKLLEQQSADALYDIENNKIIISKSLQQALADTPEQLQKYADQMVQLAHEADHALFFDLGELSLKDISLGLQPGKKAKSFNQTSAFAQSAALESLDYARQQNPAMTEKEQAALLMTEASASDFEQHTQDILDNIAATATFDNAFGDFKQEKAAFRKALENIEAYLSEGLNHLAKVLTDFGKNLASKAQTLISGLLTGNRTTRQSSQAYSGFQYVRRGKGSPTRLVNQPDDIPDPWEFEGEYRRATPVQGTTPQLPRTDPRGIGQRVRVRVRKPIQQTVKGTQQAIEQATEAFNSRLANHVETNYQEILKEIASLSGADFDAKNLPELTVNESALAKAGKEALYDAQKNQIIISRQTRELLKSNPIALAQYSKKLKPLIEASRASIEGATAQEAEEFSKRSGEVLARVSTRAKGKRSNYAVPIKGMAENLELAIDSLALGAQESEKLKKRARLFLNSLKQAAKTPENMNPVVPATEKAKPYTMGKGTSLQSIRRAYREIQNPTPFLPEGNTLQRVAARVTPRPVRKAIQEQTARAQQAAGVDFANPKSVFQKLDQAVQAVNKRFKVPIELYAKLNIKGLADVIQDLQKIVGKELDNLQEKAQALPFFGDLAGQAVGGLKAFTMAGAGAGIVALRFLSVLGRFTALVALAAQIQLVALQFDGLKKSFVLASNEANRGAETFDRVMQSASQLGVDKATAAQGATEIFGNVTQKMGARAAEQVNRAAQEASLIYASNPQQSQQVFSAFATLTDESTLSMQSFQQLMKAIPGSLDTAARSMGMTNAEFQNFLQSNNVLVEDFLPRFVQQLNIDNKPKLAGAMDTLTVATNRYNNAIVDMQLEIGKTITPIEKLRVQSAAWIAENPLKHLAGIFAKWSTSMAVLSLVKFGIAGKNLLATIVPIILKLPLMQAGILALTVAVKAVLPIIGKMVWEFLAFQLAIDALSAVWKSFNNAGGQFNTWAEESAARVDNLAKSFDKAKESADGLGKNLPTDEKDLKATGSRFEDTLIGSVIGKENTRWLEGKLDQGLQKIDPTWKSYAQKELYEKDEAVQQLVQSGGAISQRVLDMRIGKDDSLKEFTAIEKQLEDIRMQRRALASTDSGDTTGLRKLREQERALLKQRDIKGAPIQQLQSDVAAQIKVYEDALSKIDDEAAEEAWTQEAYDRATQSLRMSLTEAEKEQKYLNSQIKDSTTALLALQRQFQKLNAELADNANTLQKKYNTALQGIYANDSLSSAQKQFAQQAADQDLLAQKLQANKRTALEMRESLAAQGGEDILANYKVDVNTTDVQGFQLLAQRAEAQGNAKEQEVFTQYSRIKELELETSDMETQVLQRRSETQQQLKDLNKQVDEYYRGISRQAAESQIQIAKQTSELQNQQYANQVNAAMLGTGDNIISQFVGSILDSILQIAQAADGSYDAQSQILQSQNAFEDTFRSGEELRKQLPNLQIEGELPTLPVEVNVDSVAANEDIAALGDMIGSAVDETDDLAAATAGVNAMMGGSGDIISQNTSDIDNLQSGLVGVSDAIDMGNTSANTLNDSVNYTTDSAGYLQSQIDLNTMAIDGSDAAMQAVGASTDANIAKTEETIKQTTSWYAWLGNEGVGGALKSALDQIGLIGLGIMDGIKKTVDWFKTFANNIPILNTIGQTISGWGQSIANSGIGQAVGNAAGNLAQQGGNLWNQGVGAVRGVLGMGQGVGNIGKYNIVESVGQRNERVTSYADLEKHHPSSGREAGRNYETINGQLEEIRRTRDGRTLIKKDFVLSKNGSQNVDIPAFASGYIKRLNDSVNTVQIYQDKAMTKLIGQSLHMNNIPVKTGDYVRYGQSIGKQSGAGGYATHAHLEMELANFTQYMADLNDGVFEGTKGKVVEHQLGDGHNHYGEEDIKKANQQVASQISDPRDRGVNTANPTRATASSAVINPFAGGSNSFAARVVGHSEGNRTATGGFNSSYRGHGDPGNGQRNVGSFSVQTGTHGNMSAEAADKYWQEKLAQVLPQFQQAAKAAGLDPNNPVLLANFLDLYTQSPLAATNGGYKNFLSQLPKIAQAGGSEASILEARISGYYRTNGRANFPGFGNDPNRLRKDQQRRMAAIKAALPNATQALGISMPSGNAVVGSPQQASVPAYQPVAPMQVWTPESLSASGNARISQAQTSAQLQRDAQQAAAAQQQAVQAETATIQTIQKSQQALIQVQKQLRQAGYETRDTGEDVAKMNLEALGPLTLPQQREQAIQEQQRQYRAQGEKIDELIIDRENRKQAAQAILDLPEGIITPAMRAKFDKILALPISEDLKNRLRTELDSGSLGEGLKQTLQQSVAQADQELGTLRKAKQELETGREAALKATQERFAFEEKARANAAKFEQESLDISVLQARLEQLKGQADREGVGSEALKQIPAMEALIGLREKQLDYDKQIEDLEKQKRDKTLTEDEANKRIASLKALKDTTTETIKQNQAYQELVNARNLEARNREASLEQARAELAVTRQQIEALKALPESDVRRNEIPLLEYQVELQETQLKLQEDIAAVNESVFKGDRTKEQGEARTAELKKEYQLNVANLGVRLKQQTVEQELAQQRAILGLREQELGFAEQLLEAQSRSIELGRTTGDTLGSRYQLQADQQKLAFEKQLLDVKEMGLQSGKSAEEIAAIEANLRKVNDITLDNITGEMEKAFSDRAFGIQQRIGESNNSVLSAEQSLMSTYGFTGEANRLGKEIAVNQQQMDFTSQKRDLEEFIKTNAVAADQAKLLRDNLASVNDIKFREIEAQFNPLKGVIDSSVDALKGAFKSLIKDGKVDFDSFFDGILDSIADFLSNMLVEELMGFLSPGKDKAKGGEIFPNATADPNANDPFSGVADPLGLIGGKSTSIFESGTASLLGTSPMQPQYVSVVNSGAFGFAQGAQNNIVPFSTQGMSPLGSLTSFAAGSGSIFGSSPNYLTAIGSSLGGFADPMASFTNTNPLPVGIQQAKPDLFSSILGLGGGQGGGGIASLVGSLTGGGAGGGLVGTILSIATSFLGFAKGGVVGGHHCAQCSRYATGGVIGSGRGAKDDQLILAQRGEGILTHDGMRAIGGAATLNAINRTKGYRVPRFANGGVVAMTGEYGGRGAADAVEKANTERRRDSNKPIKVESEIINSTEYVTMAQARELANVARQQGARDGATYVSEKLMNSTKFRNQHGIR